MKTCYNCGKNIISKNDANVLAFLGFILRIFCNNCYSSKERGFFRHILYSPKAPINSKIYFWGGIFITALFILMTIPLFYSNTITSPVIKGIILFVWILIIVYIWVLRAVAMSKIKDLK